MAYWSDIVHPKAVAGAKGIKAAAARRLDADRPKSIDELLDDAGVKATQKAKDFAAALHAALAQDTPNRGGPGKKVLPLPGFLRRPISRAFVNAFIADTSAYFFNDANRRKIRQRLIDALPPAPTQVVLVAHSQGTIVALEVLSELGKRVDVIRLVTIGSPLGIREVQDYLDAMPGGLPFFIPASVERWFNFADPFDPVALDKGLANDFVPRPDADVAVGPIVDEVVVNTQSRQIIRFNPHSAAGYLANPKVRKCVYQALRHDAMARFVVARDVAEALAADQRVPLLIEVLEPGYGALGETDDDRKAREAKEPVPLLADRIRRAADDVRKVVRTVAKYKRRESETGGNGRADRHASPLRRRAPDAGGDPARRRAARQLQHLRGVAEHVEVQTDQPLACGAAGRRALETYGARGDGITWAVLDTGIRSDHPHFKDRIVEIWDCTKTGAPRRLASDRDRDGHGSHVAGIIAGVDPKDARMSGVAPRARLVIYKVLDDDGEGEDAWIIKALDHIAETNENKESLAVHGLNLSLGGPYDSTVYGCGFSPICQELRRLWRSGVLVVVASGNEGQLEVQTQDGEVEINTPMSIGDPANLEDCIAVGSVHADKPHLYGVLRVFPRAARPPTAAASPTSSRRVNESGR
jgi:subtilisin family serine protease